jgi:DNA recombination protein RmuC
VRILGEKSLTLDPLSAALIGAALIATFAWLAWRLWRQAQTLRESREVQRRDAALQREREALGEANAQQLDTLLDPLKRDLAQFRGLIQERGQQSLDQHIAIKSELHLLRQLNQRLGSEAQALSRALSGDTKAQGNWGEWQLERLLEAGGLKTGVHFETQVSLDLGGARQQPDVMIRLPHGRDVIVDAKVSLTAYTRHSAGSANALSEHVKSLKAHITGLADRAYPAAPQLHSLDLVLLYVPIEAALNAALEAEPALIDFAQRRQIMLCGPSTLLLAVKLIANLWQVDQHQRHADEIARKAGQLYDKFAQLYSDLETIDSQLGRTQTLVAELKRRLRDGRGSLVQRVEELKSLGARTSRTLPDASPDGHELKELRE